MSSTRRKSESDPSIHQGKYLSSPEFVESRGINGPAVATKIESLDSHRQKELLLFLQWLSLEPGGVKRLAQTIIDEFPDRICTPTMHRLDLKSGQHFSGDQVAEIRSELDDDNAADAMRSLGWAMGESKPTYDQPVDCEIIKAECREVAAAKLPAFLIRLCIDPRVHFRAPGEKGCGLVEVPYFRDISGALFEFQRAYIERAAAAFVETTISREVHQCLNAWMRLGKIIVIEGESRIGKTTAAEAWCKLHAGRIRFVRLNGFANKTTTLRKIARTLGIGCTHCHAPKDMEPLICDVLSKTGIMLVIDEAHFLFTQGQRIYSRPEMIDWFDTELFNNGIPVALITTPQFVKCMAVAERQVGWNGEQFKGRVGEWKILPDAVTRDDLFAVAKSKLPQAPASCLKFVVGYALTSKRYMPALVDSIERAGYLAAEDGRDSISQEDIERAVRDFVMPSEKAKARTFGAQPKRRFSATPDVEMGAGSADLVAEPAGRGQRECRPPAETRMSGGRGSAAPVLVES